MNRVSNYYRQRCELIAKCAESIEERAGGPSITSREMWDSAARYLETAILIENEGPHVENPWTLADVTEEVATNER